MLLLHRATKARSTGGRIGLAVAGGGPTGGMYELGALRALDDAIDGLDLTRLEVYVGVSSGAFLAAGLANRMSSAEMTRVFIVGEPGDARFRPEAFLRPAFADCGGVHRQPGRRATGPRAGRRPAVDQPRRHQRRQLAPVERGR